MPPLTEPEPPFRQLRDALTQLALDAGQQRQVLAGFTVTDEMADDLDHAVTCLAEEAEHTGLTLPPEFVTAVHALDQSLSAPADDRLWDDEALDDHPVWIGARAVARRLLELLPSDCPDPVDAP